mmetsp:Transcript_41850/g.115342  ORF Transcript_41850/g.115342 Transcript_41850/m.115342 type:complete len:536 (-) Transcript_41850:61-1668(-)
MSTESVELLWRAGAYAVVWKVPGVPVTDAVAKPPEALDKDKDKGKGKGRGRRGRGGRAPTLSVCAWAERHLEGAWDPANLLDVASPGLVLLYRRGVPPPNPVRGTYALLVAPENPASQASVPQAGASWEPLDLFGGLDDDARVVREGPSGHFGRLALVEIDVPLNGSRAMSPLGAVLALQELGLRVVQLSGVRGSEMRYPLLPSQAGTQVDIIAGTCVSLVAIHIPQELLRIKTVQRAASQHVNKSGLVVHDPPSKFDKLLMAEQALAAQSAPAKDNVVMFRNLPFVAPEEQLRPRPSSGALVDAAIAALASEPQRNEVRVLDLGVGSGALLLAMLHELGEGAHGTGVDIDAGAVEAFKSNASRLLSMQRAARVGAVLADFRELDAPAVRSQLDSQGYDVVLCNPPYRSEAQQEAYARASGKYGGYTEHCKTLVAGKTGLEMYEGIASCLARDAAQVRDRKTIGTSGPEALLREGGTVIMQVEAGCHGQRGGMAARVGAAVQQAAEGRLVVTGVHTDEAGLERAILVKHAPHLRY